MLMEWVTTSRVVLTGSVSRLNNFLRIFSCQVPVFFLLLAYSCRIPNMWLTSPAHSRWGSSSPFFGAAGAQWLLFVCFESYFGRVQSGCLCLESGSLWTQHVGFSKGICRRGFGQIIAKAEFTRSIVPGVICGEIKDGFCFSIIVCMIPYVTKQ